jgi:hypothetical protein
VNETGVIRQAHANQQKYFADSTVTILTELQRAKLPRVLHRIVFDYATGTTLVLTNTQPAPSPQTRKPFLSANCTVHILQPTGPPPPPSVPPP